MSKRTSSRSSCLINMSQRISSLSSWAVSWSPKVKPRRNACYPALNRRMLAPIKTKLAHIKRKLLLTKRKFHRSKSVQSLRVSRVMKSNPIQASFTRRQITFLRSVKMVRLLLGLNPKKPSKRNQKRLIAATPSNLTQLKATLTKCWVLFISVGKS